MADISTVVAGLVTFGGTVVNPDGGVFASYDLTTFYEAKAAGTLSIPALLALEELGEQSGWQSFAFMGKAAKLEFTLEHQMLFRTVAENDDYPKLLPKERQCIINYFAALGATPYFTPATAPAIHYAPKTSWRKGRIAWDGVMYIGVIFLHDVAINL